MKRRLALWTLALVLALMAGTGQNSYAGAPAQATAPQVKVPAANLIDINSASLDQLKSLPGIGDAYAQKIVDGRPYARKDQLVQKKIIPQGVYNKIAPLIIAKQPK